MHITLAKSLRCGSGSTRGRPRKGRTSRKHRQQGATPPTALQRTSRPTGAVQKVEVVSAQLQELINHYASYGWELVQVSDVSLTVDTGCLGALFGRGSYQISCDQVVFRQPI